LLGPRKGRKKGKEGGGEQQLQKSLLSGREKKRVLDFTKKQKQRKEFERCSIVLIPISTLERGRRGEKRGIGEGKRLYYDHVFLDKMKERGGKGGKIGREKKELWPWLHPGHPAVHDMKKGREKTRHRGGILGQVGSSPILSLLLQSPSR